MKLLLLFVLVAMIAFSVVKGESLGEDHQTTFDDCGEGYVRNDNGCKRLKHRSTEETPAPIVIPSEHPIFSGKAGEYTIGDVKIHICPGMGSSGFGRKFMEDSFSTTSEFDPTSLTSEV